MEEGSKPNQINGILHEMAELLPGEMREGFVSKNMEHLSDMVNAAQHCALSPVVEGLMRIGDERFQANDFFEHEFDISAGDVGAAHRMREAKARFHQLHSKFADVLEDYLAENYNSSCACKLKGCKFEEEPQPVPIPVEEMELTRNLPDQG
jgi:hypothetical protein